MNTNGKHWSAFQLNLILLFSEATGDVSPIPAIVDKSANAKNFNVIWNKWDTLSMLGQTWLAF